jgi:protein-disulfide isomerase
VGAITMAGVAVAALVLILLVTGAPGSTTATDALRAPASVPVQALVDGRTLGAREAPLTLRVFSDYQCPICRRFATDYLPRLVDDFVIAGRLRIVDEPIAILGNGSPDESLASAVGAVCAAEQGAYWSYHDWLFANQAGENRGGFAPTRLSSIAQRTVPDANAWAECIADPSRATAVAARSQTALSAGITSTPTFLLGERSFVGLSRTYDDFRATVEDALAAIAP